MRRLGNVAGSAPLPPTAWRKSIQADPALDKQVIDWKSGVPRGVCGSARRDCHTVHPRPGARRLKMACCNWAREMQVGAAANQKAWQTA